MVIANNKKEDIGDNADLKYVLLDYVFTNKRPDSSNQTTITNNELTPGQVKSLKKRLERLLQFS